MENNTTLHECLNEPCAIWNKTYTDYIQREVRKRVISSDPDVIHDIVRDVQTKIFVQERRFNRSFIKSVVGTTVLDFFRSSSSKRRLIENFSTLCRETSTSSPEQVAIDTSLLDYLKPMMSPWQLEAFRMMAAGYTQQEIFDSFGKNHCKSHGNFRTKIHRLRVFLHSIAGQYIQA